MPKLSTFLVALGALLTSCANVSSDYAFEKGKTVGLVVGSISYESGLGRYHLIIAGADGAKPIQLSFGCSMLPCLFENTNDAEYSASEKPKQRGGGFAVEVPEGNYRIVGWRVQQGYINSRSKAPIDLAFTVKAGSASYLGNLHFDAHWENVVLRDRAARDLPLLQKNYSVLKAIPFAYTIAPETEIQPA
jgi:hypothetical protein